MSASATGSSSDRPSQSNHVNFLVAGPVKGKSYMDVTGWKLTTHVRSIQSARLMAMAGRLVRLNDEFESEVNLKLAAKDEESVKGALVQSRAGQSGECCSGCSPRNLSKRIFTECIHSPAHFNGVCGNCMWHGEWRTCSIARAVEHMSESSQALGAPQVFSMNRAADINVPQSSETAQPSDRPEHGPVPCNTSHASVGQSGIASSCALQPASVRPGLTSSKSLNRSDDMIKSILRNINIGPTGNKPSGNTRANPVIIDDDDDSDDDDEYTESDEGEDFTS